MASNTALPPRWVIRTLWTVHRRAARIGDGRLVLRAPRPGQRAGVMRLRTVGRRSGRQRDAMLDYLLDGDDLVTLAMNGWDRTHPAWFLNLRDRPNAEVDTVDGTRRVHARVATTSERERLWPSFQSHAGWGDVDAFTAGRPIATPVVILSPGS